jgi:hypothetical protein
VVGKNMTFDGSRALSVDKPVGYRVDIIIMTGTFVNILKLMLFGEVINN